MAKAPDSFNSIPEAFFDIAAREPSLRVYSQAKADKSAPIAEPRKWQATDYQTVAERVQKVAYYLRSIGVRLGAKVAIISNSRPEWLEADIAALTAAAAVVSVYQSLPADEIGYILFDSDAEIVFAENQEQVDKLLDLLARPVFIPATEEREELHAQIGVRRIIAFEKVREHPLVEQYDKILSHPLPKKEVDTYRLLKRDDLAALVYTSGTTGPPKGVMQTHGNHLANVRQVLNSNLVDGSSSILLILPLAHSFAKLMGYIGFLLTANLKFPAIVDRQTSKLNPESITKDISEAQATIVPIVPRLLEKMQAGVEERLTGVPVAKYLGKFTLWSGARRAESKGRLVAPLCSVLTAPIRKKVRKKLFGPKFKFAVSGGAKLSVDVAKFFSALGIDILEGYGLTETCVATNVNPLTKIKIGTVGPVLSSDIEIRIDRDGEILFRGPNVALGYYHREAATANAWDADGWFHTGDLGELDADGYLSIVGRKKELLITSYGKNVAPEKIEAKLQSSRFISQVLLVGDGRPFCVALISLNMPAVSSWLEKKGFKVEAADLPSSQLVFDLIWSEVKKLNKSIAQHASPKRIALLAEEPTIENGLLTPTFKIKRNVMEKRYKDIIDELYALKSA